MSDSFNNLSDEHLKAIADGKFDSLPDEVLHQIAGGPAVAPMQAAKPNPYAQSSRADLLAAQQGIIDNDPESLRAKAGMAARALGSATLKIGLPAAAVAAAPFTGGGSLAALGAGAGVLGEYLGNKVAGEETTPGGLAAAGIVNAVPGASLVDAGLGQVARQGAKYALTNVAAANAKSVLDNTPLPSARENALAAVTGFGGAAVSRLLGAASNRLGQVETAASQDAVRRETLNAGRKLGLVVPPSAVAPNGMNDTFQSLAGKAATAQEAILRNQPKINAAVRAEIGLPESAPLSPIALNTARMGPNIVYEEVSKLTPASAGILEKFKDATAEANISRQAYRASIDAGKRNPALLEAAQASDAVAEQMRKALGREAESEGANTRNAADIMQRFDAARERLAKIGLTERAVNPGNGNLDPAVIGQALEHREKLTGAFKTIGRYENAFGRYLKEASTTPPSGVDYLKGVAKLGLGGSAGYSAGGPLGAIAGIAAMHGLEKGARAHILSPRYQAGKGFTGSLSGGANPFYGAATEDLNAQLARRSVMQAGRSN